MQDLENTDNILSLVENDIDDDEIDLVKLVSTNANDSNQYLLFLGSDNQYYAKNVSKIEELLVYKDLDIAYNNDDNSFILGTANIRGQMTSIVNFDKWIGNKVLDDELYELVIIASYGGKRFALVVKEVEYITTIDSKSMSDNSSDNSKSLFISEVSINGKNELCTVFDSDMLLLDIFDNIKEKSNIEINNYQELEKNDKLILFADDSKFVRKMVEKLFIQLEVKYKIYNDGKHLIEDLANINSLDIGLIITDIEMPGASGREVIDFVRQNNMYNDINIIIHTNMSDDITENELRNKDISDIIGKINMKALADSIIKFIK